MRRAIPLLLLALADLPLGLRWLWLGGGVIGRADGTGEGMIGLVILLGGLATMASAALILLVARRAHRFSLHSYVLAVAMCTVIAGLPWLAFATVP